jgi:hypothetical protein
VVAAECISSGTIDPMGDARCGPVRAPYADVIAPLIGRPAWGVRQGHATTVTFEFGRPQSSGSGTEPRGDWRLWIYRTAWRIEDSRSVLAACGDGRRVTAEALARLEGRPLVSVEASRPSFDTVFGFDGIFVRTFDVWSSPDDRGNESWKLYTPANRVLVVGPGRRWSYRPNPPTH